MIARIARRTSPFALGIILAATLPLSSDAKPREPLVIEGRAAQALHCSAMLFMVSGVIYDAGLIARVVRDDAQRAALMMLEHVPGTDKQRIQAMSQRFERIMQNRSPQELVEEYHQSERWCQREFLPR